MYSTKFMNATTITSEIVSAGAVGRKGVNMTTVNIMILMKLCFTCTGLLKTLQGKQHLLILILEADLQISRNY